MARNLMVLAKQYTCDFFTGVHHMSAILTSLKLVTAKRQGSVDPVQFRRNKLSHKLKEQISMAIAYSNGEPFTVKRQRNVRNEHGLIHTIEVEKKPKPWWFTTANNKVCVQVKYGSKALVLTPKGDKNSVEVSNPEELIVVLKKLDEATINGELDAAIQLMTESVKSRFKK
jgi:hypothetical protein